MLALSCAMWACQILTTMFEQTQSNDTSICMPNVSCKCSEHYKSFLQIRTNRRTVHNASLKDIIQHATTEHTSVTLYSLHMNSFQEKFFCYCSQQQLCQLGCRLRRKTCSNDWTQNLGRKCDKMPKLGSVLSSSIQNVEPVTSVVRPYQWNWDSKCDFPYSLENNTWFHSRFRSLYYSLLFFTIFLCPSTQQHTCSGVYHHTGKWIQSLLDLFCDSASTAALTENDIN